MGKVTPFTDEERERIRELHGKGYTREAIATELGRSEAGVYKVATRMGLRFARRHAEPEPVEPRPVPVAEQDRPRASEPAQPPAVTRIVDESAVDGGPESIDPAVWLMREMREALARRDISTVYELLKLAGVSQRQIAALVDQSQSEVSEVCNGRQVISCDVLVRIADGFGIPRGWMGLAHSDGPIYRHQGGWSGPGGDEDEALKRRQALLVSAAAIMFDRPVLGDVLGFGAAGQAWAEYPTPLPQWLGRSDVAAVRNLTEAYRAVGREHGGLGEVVSPVALRADQLLKVPGAEVTVTAMHSAVADLHTLAGWCAYDGGDRDTARWHYERAVRVAGEVDDALRQVSAVQHAAIMDRECGDPGHALKLYQVAQARLVTLPDPSRQAVTQVGLGWLAVQSARAFALLGRSDEARRELARSPEPADQFDKADLLHLKALIALDLGDLDAAELHAAASVATWGPGDLREAALAKVTLAVIHASAGEADTARLATAALDAVVGTNSVRGRAELAPLESALMRRGDSTGLELARWARAVRTGS